MDEGTSVSETGQGVNGRCEGEEGIIQAVTSYACGSSLHHGGGNKMVLYTIIFNHGAIARIGTGRER